MGRELPENTPHRLLYQPLHIGWQIPILVVIFLASFWAGIVPRLCFGNVSPKAAMFLHLPFPAVFILGYAGWAARSEAIVVELLGRSVFKTVIYLLFRRGEPLSHAALNEDTVRKLFVRMQKAASSFLWVSVGIAFLVGVGALFISSSLFFLFRPIAAAASIVLWGWLLMFLGRRGYLFMPGSGN